MPQLKNRYVLLIIIFLIVILFLLHRYSIQKSSTPAASAQPAAQLSGSSLPSAISQIHCLDQQNVSQILGQTYQLQQEQFFPSDLLLECSYQSDQVVNQMNPMLHYLLRIHTPAAQTLWQMQQTTDATTSAYRQIADNSALFADVNPVKELSEVSFYGWQTQSYLKLDYTPIQEEVGVELAKGEQLSQQVLQAAPSPQ